MDPHAEENRWLERIAELTVEGLAPAPELSWLEESYGDPPSFWKGFHGMMSQGGSWPLKSVPLQKYDFFHDLMVRNHRNPAAAIRWYGPLRGWSELSYARLSELARERCSEWMASGAKAGDKICIVLPLGVDFAVSLLAALKLGAVVSCVPFSERQLLRQRLKALSPDRIVGDALVLSVLPEWKDRAAPPTRFEAGGREEPHQSYSYPSGETVALLFDPCGDTPLLPISLSSDEAYLWPLREGRLVLALRPGDKVAFPGADILETQPAVLLSVWMAGATYVHIDREDLNKNPRLLEEEELHVLGVTVPVRDLFMRALPGAHLPWRGWFRNPAESADLQPWREFVDRLRLKTAPAMNLRWRAARGGITLFSLRRVGVVHGNVYPSAGCFWKLESVSPEHEETLAEYGVLSLASLGEGGEEGEELSTSEMIARSHREWVYLGMSFPDRSGRFYPVEEVLAVLDPYQWPCSMVAAPSGIPGKGSRFILMVFVGSSIHVDKGGATTEIHRRIEKELGREFLPDHMVFLPLLPRRTDEGAIDHAWCRSQYLTGSLMRKAGSPIQRCLTKVRAILPR